MKISELKKELYEFEEGMEYIYVERTDNVPESAIEVDVKGFTKPVISKMESGRNKTYYWISNSKKELRKLN
jgi:hypothetical protein